MILMVSRIKIFIILLCIFFIIVLNYFTFYKITEKDIVIEYMDLENDLKRIIPSFNYESIITIYPPSIVQLDNGTFMMPIVYKEEFGIYQNIYLTISTNLINWTSIIKLTNYKFSKGLGSHIFNMTLIIENDILTIYYLS